jgi:hypothetical protein
VREQIVEALNTTESDDGLKEALNGILSAITRGRRGESFSTIANLRGSKVAVVAFNIRYGPEGFWNSRVFLQGFRRVGLRYEPVAEEEAYSDAGLKVQEIDSPRDGEIWMLLHGQEAPQQYMGYAESFRLYAFDGYAFKTLWWTGRKINPEIQVVKNMISITSEDHDVPPVSGSGYRLIKETVVLSSAGALASTDRLPPKTNQPK